MIYNKPLKFYTRKWSESEQRQKCQGNINLIFDCIWLSKLFTDMNENVTDSGSRLHSNSHVTPQLPALEQCKMDK